MVWRRKQEPVVRVPKKQRVRETGFVYELWRDKESAGRFSADREKIGEYSSESKLSKQEILNRFSKGKGGYKIQIGDVVKVKHKEKGLADKYKYSLEGMLTSI